MHRTDSKCQEKASVFLPWSLDGCVCDAGGLFNKFHSKISVFFFAFVCIELGSNSLTTSSRIFQHFSSNKDRVSCS